MEAGERRAWGILTGLFLLMAGLVAYIIAPASILPVFADAFEVDRSAASASISAVFLTWVALQIPAGYVMDRYDNRLLVGLGGAVFIASALGSAFVSDYGSFLALRAACGVGAVFVWIGGINILQSVFPASRRPLATTTYVASPPFGSAVALYTGPLLAARFDWRAPLLAFAVLGVLGLVAFTVLLRRPVEVDATVTIAQFLAALRNVPVLLVSLACFCSYTIWTFLTTWMPTYGTDVLGIELAVAGAATALVPVAGIVARPAGGWLSHRLGGRLSALIGVSFIATVPLLYGLSVAPSATAFAALLALSGAAVNLAIGLYFVYVNRLTEAATSATSLSVLSTFSQVGNLVAPVAGGWLIDGVSWTAGFGFVAALAVVGLVVVSTVSLTS